LKYQHLRKHRRKRHKQRRLDTFYERARNWPRHRLTATPADMADAGLYYLGTDDKVKCFYCNGGLQNWDTYDEPWFEHAKWFPDCEFLLQQRGPEYVERVKNRFPNLKRPTSQDSRNNRTNSNNPTIIDPASNHRLVCEKVDRAICTSPIIPEATQMGFSTDNIKQALYAQIVVHDEPFTTLSALVQALLDQPEDQKQSHNQEFYTSSHAATVQTPLQELNMLKRQRQCKRCCTETATVVCIPCGHLAICKNCSPKITRCPVCMIKTSNKIATFIA